MRISARCDYACKALLELTLHWPGTEPLHAHMISEKQDIPLKYLVQILLQLKRMGLVASVRGKEGGYTLAKAPRTITLGEVIRNLGGPLLPIASSAVNENTVFATVWVEVEEAMAAVLDTITLEDVADKAKSMKKALVYQI